MGYLGKPAASQANHWLLHTKKEGCAMRTPNPNRENLTLASPAKACRTPMAALLKESQRAALTCVKFVKN
jgi:hypothetical protein